MEGLSEADAFILSRIKDGDASAWEEIVDKYQGRLLAFARNKTHGRDAEDLVQDTFISFIQSLDRFRGDASLETYLFTILRRKIIDTYRSKKNNTCLIQDVVGPDGMSSHREEASSWVMQLPGAEPTASVHMRNDEALDTQRDALASALKSVIDDYKKKLNFRDLKIIEMLFYCRMKNNAVAKHLKMEEKQIGLIKHRCLKKIADLVQASLGEVKLDGHHIDDLLAERIEGADSIIADIWESMQLSSLKRSTIGAWMLGTLDKDWADYVDFRINTIGCEFDRANYEDLKEETEKKDHQVFRDRIMQSSIGFLSARPSQ